MQFEPKSSAIAAALVYAAAAAFSVGSLWLVMSSAYDLDIPNRNLVLTQLRFRLFAWGLLGVAGVAFAVIAMRFSRLSIAVRRTSLVGSCALALAAGLLLEWWQSLYFLFPALLLAFAFREAAHA